MGGKRIPDGLSVFQEARQSLLDVLAGPGLLYAQRRRRSIRAQSVTVPDFTLQVLGLTQQGGFTVGRDEQPGIRFGEAAQVVKVTVVAVGKLAVAVARIRGRGGDEGNAAGAELLCQVQAALCVQVA